MKQVYARIAALVVTAGTVLFAVSAANAQSGSTIQITGPAALVINSDSFPPAGTSLLISDSGLLIVQGPGSLEIIDGSLSLTDQGRLSLEGGSSSSITNGSTSLQDNARISLTGGSTLTTEGGFLQTNGTTEIEAGSRIDGTGSFALNDGTVIVDGDLIRTGVTVSGGTLAGIGTVSGGVDNTGGTVGAGVAPGTLSVEGGYTQGPGGTLAIEIGSLLAFDALNVTGGAALGGILDLDVDAGYAATAQVGESFTIMEWDGVSGAFDTVTGLNFGADKFFALDYGATGLTLTVSTSAVAASEPGMIALMGLGLIGIGLTRRRRKHA
tara:strand:- start:4027 stop:5001 length:975 start_codon:yes stop_codon:yes gene_type:complete